MLLLTLVQLQLAIAGSAWSYFSIENYQYSINAYIGTPPQPLTVVLDFGTADLLVVPNRCSNGYCKNLQQGEAFNLSASNTLSTNRSAFSVEFASSNSISGLWAQDTFEFCGHTIDDLQFAIRSDIMDLYYTTANLSTEILVPSTIGLGPKGLECSVSYMSHEGRLEPTYDNFMYRLDDDVQHSFSLWVDPSTKEQGLLIFGGMDPQYYNESTYATVPLLRLDRRVAEVPLGQLSDISFLYYQVYMDYLVPGESPEAPKGVLNSTESSYNQRNKVLRSDDPGIVKLDTQESFTLTSDMLFNLTTALGATWSTYMESFVLPCSTQAMISIVISSNYALIIDIKDYLIDQYLVDADGNEICGLAISAGERVVLNNGNLINYFVAVNYEDDQISFATPKNISAGVQPSQITPVSSATGFPIMDPLVTLATTSVPAATYNAQNSTSLQLTTLAAITAGM